MGEIVRINAGSKARGFEGVDKLRTQLSGGGTCLWVPSYGVRLGTKRVTENGTYSAADEQLYGYSSVQVNVDAEVDQLTGKGQDGNDYSVTKNGSGGLVETKVPSEIRVTTLPTTIQYDSGDVIDFSGIVVTAYYGDGSVCEDVPFNELIFPITQAQGDGDIYGTASSDLETVIQQPIRYSNYFVYRYEYDAPDYYLARGMITQFVYATEDTKNLYKLNISDTAGYYVTEHKLYSNGTESDYHSPLINEYTNDGKKVYWSVYGTTFGAYPDKITYMNMQPYSVRTQISDENLRKIAWTILYGEGEPTGAHAAIPVQWRRNCDGSLLETDFYIDIVLDSLI